MQVMDANTALTSACAGVCALESSCYNIAWGLTLVLTNPKRDVCSVTDLYYYYNDSQSGIIMIT